MSFDKLNILCNTEGQGISDAEESLGALSLTEKNELGQSEQVGFGRSVDQVFDVLKEAVGIPFFDNEKF